MAIYPTLLTLGLLLNLMLANWLLGLYAFVWENTSGSMVTSLLFEVHALLNRWWLALLIIPLGIAWLVSVPRFRIKVPRVGASLAGREACNFLVWLELALRHTPSLPQAIRQAAGAGCIPPCQAELQAMAANLESGATFAQAVKRLSLFPPLARWLLEQAERAEFRPGSLSLASQALLRHGQNRTRVTMAFVEPVITMVLGSMLFLVFLVLFFPMLKMAADV